jgi:ketosteroid isomerase-like protein
MESIIQQFYDAFADLDAEGMAACYHDDVVFEDPAFGRLEGERARNMWRMLLGTQTKITFKVTSSGVCMDGDTGIAHWEALYVFSKTNRNVHNKIDAEFEFKDGKIISHKDSFSLYSWAKQALGLSGYLIGWAGFFKRKLQVQTNGLLDKFEEKQVATKFG